jgi:hypothetical protein
LAWQGNLKMARVWKGKATENRQRARLIPFPEFGGSFLGWRHDISQPKPALLLPRVMERAQ